MDEYSQQVVLFLEALAQCNAEFIALRHRLSHHPEVITVHRLIECHPYQTGSMLDGYVEAELRTGIACTWWFDLTWTSEQWTIDSKVTVNADQGQEVIHEYPPLHSQTVVQCVSDLIHTISVLVADADTRDLSNPR